MQMISGQFHTMVHMGDVINTRSHYSNKKVLDIEYNLNVKIACIFKISEYPNCYSIDTCSLASAVDKSLAAFGLRVVEEGWTQGTAGADLNRLRTDGVSGEAP